MDVGLILGSAQDYVHSFGLDEFFCLTPNMNTTSKFSSRGRTVEPRGGRLNGGQTWSLTVCRGNMWRIKGKTSLSKTPVSNNFSTSFWQTGFPFFSEPHCLMRPNEKQRPAWLTGYTEKAQYFRISLTI